MNRIILNTGKEKSLLRKHPWVFSGAIKTVEGQPEMGETVAVLSQAGGFMGYGAFNPFSSIRVRMWSYTERTIDSLFFYNRLHTAIEFRDNQPDLVNTTNAYRLVFGEADGLPGLIVDRYDDFLVLQVMTAGMEIWRETVTDALIELTNIKNIYERSDVDVRKLEGLAPRIGRMSGKEPPKLIEITENEMKFLVDIKGGQKTGFYLDQRANRHIIGAYAQGKSILNCFAYTGGFTVLALINGAQSVVSIDSSQPALNLAQENVMINGLDSDLCQWKCADVFQELRTMRDKGEKFDLVILDPPKFAPTVSHAQSAARGYKDINLLAFKLLKEGGRLMTFSCSGGINRDLFQKIVADACLDAGLECSIIAILSQAPDHPVALNFPESAYLKGMICQRK